MFGLALPGFVGDVATEPVLELGPSPSADFEGDAACDFEGDANEFSLSTYHELATVSNFQGPQSRSLLT